MELLQKAHDLREQLFRLQELTELCMEREKIKLQHMKAQLKVLEFQREHALELSVRDLAAKLSVGVSCLDCGILCACVSSYI